MACFIRGTDDDRTPVQHSNDIFEQYLKNFSLLPLMGSKDSGRPIITDDTLKGKPGDTVVYHFIPQNDDDGIVGQNKTITGNESTLDEMTDSFKLEYVAKAFKKKGQLTDKRIIWDFRKQAKNQLANWYKARSEVWMFDALTGLITNGLDYITGYNPKTGLGGDGVALVNGEGRCVRADGANSWATVAAASSTNTALLAAMDTTDVMNTYLLDELSRLAVEGNGTYAIAPYKLNSNGEEMYVLIMSKQAARTLRQDSRFEKYAVARITSGISAEKDPIISKAMGIWGNLILMETSRIRKFQNTDGTKVFSRNLLLGANAAALCYAQTLDYREELSDYGNQLGMCADEIRAQKKLVFDGVDQGVMQVITSSL